jgi:hypothetical protein
MIKSKPCKFLNCNKKECNYLHNYDSIEDWEKAGYYNWKTKMCNIEKIKGICDRSIC